MCIATGVPLVESGTAGYLGQVTVHIDQKTSCFDCYPRPSTTKTYPICTIRHTPDKPIHCIVWAKDLLFSRLLGPKDAVSDFDGRAAAEEGGGGGEDGAGDGAEDVSFFVKADGEDASAYARRVFKRFFREEIERLLAVEGMFENRESVPTPLDVDALSLPAPDADGSPTSAAARLGLGDAQRTWTLEQNAAVFIESVRMFFELRGDEVGAVAFDKDDDLAVELVASAANLRMANYGIRTQSLFEAKGMAGNIIHAIATTNAIIAGLIVLEAKKVLRRALGACRSTYLLMYPSNSKLILPTSPEEPRPECAVCRPTKARLVLEADLGQLTYGGLVDGVLKGTMGLVEPEVFVGTELIYEEDEDDDFGFSAHMGKTLREHGKVAHGTFLEMKDEERGFEAQMVVRHRDGGGTAFAVHGEWEPFFGKTSFEGGEEEAEQPGQARAQEQAQVREEGGVIVLDDGDGGGGQREGGEAREAMADGAEQAEEEAVIVLDDDEDGDDAGAKRRGGDSAGGERLAKRARNEGAGPRAVRVEGV